MSSSAPRPQPFDSALLHQSCLHGSRAQQEAAYQILWRYLLPVAAQLVRQAPDADDLAADLTQQALIRIHQRAQECHTPAAFRSWCRRITTNLALDELRRRKRLVYDEQTLETAAVHPPAETPALRRVHAEELRTLLAQAPISERSFRVVTGRYLDAAPDEQLAATESDLAATPVLPSHVQVTRSKNLAKLREWPELQTFWAQAGKESS